MGDSATVETGGRYVEDEDFEPNPADLRRQFNTSGLGASHRIEETAAVYDVDKVRTAEHVVRALDPEDRAVPADRVILPDPDLTREEAADELREAAQARLDEKVVLGGQTPAELEAEEEGDDEPGDDNPTDNVGRAEGGGSLHSSPGAGGNSGTATDPAVGSGRRQGSKKAAASKKAEDKDKDDDDKDKGSSAQSTSKQGPTMGSGPVSGSGSQGTSKTAQSGAKEGDKSGSTTTGSTGSSAPSGS